MIGLIIIWKADYEGEHFEEDLRKLQALQKHIQEEIGGTAEGPFLPQDASVVYIFHVKEYEWLNKAAESTFPKSQSKISPLFQNRTRSQ